MKLTVLILGYGEMGHAMETLLRDRHDVCVWSRSSGMHGRASSLQEAVAQARVILFCVPAAAHQQVLDSVMPDLAPESLSLSVAKGLDESGQTAARVLASAMQGRGGYGILCGPMIAEEVCRDRLAFADVALSDPAHEQTITRLFHGSRLVCRFSPDMQGSAWAMVLKNIYAIIFGVAEAYQLGSNMRGHLMVAAMAELAAIIKALGGNERTVLGYAGLGDLMTTATSLDSHHYALGMRLAAGNEEGISGEGVHTLRMLRKFHLLDGRDWPLFGLVQGAVEDPPSLRERMQAYLAQVQAGSLRQ